jgi:hypothetical protein
MAIFLLREKERFDIRTVIWYIIWGGEMTNLSYIKETVSGGMTYLNFNGMRIYAIMYYKFHNTVIVCNKFHRCAHNMKDRRLINFHIDNGNVDFDT